MIDPDSGEPFKEEEIMDANAGARLGCIYWDKCSDAFTDKCKTCRHNPNRSHYEPVPYEPWYTDGTSFTPDCIITVH